MHNYQCQKCSTLLQSNTKPSSSHCPSGNNHLWIDLGEFGDKNFQCRKCGTLVKSKSNPSSSHCPSGNNHAWSKL